MANWHNHYRYMVKLRRILLGSGTQGISQWALNQAVRTRYFNVSDMLEILGEWEKRQWVQSFKVQKFAKRPTTIWRATILLREEWHNLTFDKPLPSAPEAEPTVVKAF